VVQYMYAALDSHHEYAEQVLDKTPSQASAVISV